jgi:hypothetical protein
LNLSSSIVMSFDDEKILLTIKKYAYVCLLHEKSNFKVIEIKMSYEHIWECTHGVNKMVANALR